MSEPRSWLLWSSRPGAACFDGPAISAVESVRVVEAAPVEAELERLRRIENLAWDLCQAEWESERLTRRDALMAALEASE